MGDCPMTDAPSTATDLPSNATIAALFDELGDLYELDGAVVHRVVAYRNAAKSVSEAPRSVAAMAREGSVTKLPGVGRTLEEKILALIETGSIPAVEKLRAKFPPGLIDLTRLPGLGPKRARKLFDELGIDSLDALQAAAEAHQLRDVRGFGEKFEETVLASLAAGAGDAPRERVLLSKALTIGEEIVDALRAHPASDRVELAGSARRLTDSVKDLDIIATASDPPALLAAFAALDILETASAPGGNAARGRTHTGVGADLRENRGELALRDGQVPALVEHADLKGDLHMHTTLSDGRNSAEEMALRARELGLEYIAITDHSASHGFGNHVAPDELKRQIEEIRKLDERLEGIRVLVGTETNIGTAGGADYRAHPLGPPGLGIGSGSN